MLNGIVNGFFWLRWTFPYNSMMAHHTSSEYNSYCVVLIHMHVYDSFYFKTTSLTQRKSLLVTSSIDIFNVKSIQSHIDYKILQGCLLELILFSLLIISLCISYVGRCI